MPGAGNALVLVLAQAAVDEVGEPLALRLYGPMILTGDIRIRCPLCCQGLRIGMNLDIERTVTKADKTNARRIRRDV